MSDYLGVFTASGLIHTGRGQLTGVVLTCSSTTAGVVTFYDNTSATGTKLFEAPVSAYSPVSIFFQERFGPKFVNGLYLSLGTGVTATVWARKLPAGGAI